MHHPLALLWLAATVLLSSCVAPIRVREVPPPPPAHSPAEAIRQAYHEASRKDPAAASALLLDGIRICESRLAAGDNAALEDYNYLISRLIGQLQSAGLSPWHGEIEVKSANTTWQLAGRQPGKINGAKRILVATDELDFEGKYAPEERILRTGVGAPVVAMAPDKVDFKQQSVPLTDHYVNLTAVVRTAGKHATIELVDPFATETVTLAGRSRTLAMDYSSTIAMALTRERVDKLGIARTLNPQKYAHTARLTFVQPYDPKRIPVLMVHGLQDTPATWMPMYLGLIQDPEIRERYQFWAFSYPSGYPFTYSAMLLRHELDRVNREYPDHQRIVIVGHSMGGIISRLMVTDAGDQLWRDYFGTPPAETRLLSSDRALLEDALIFNARDDISRAVFICAPHRGSDLASNWIGRLASRLVRAPALLADITTTASRMLQIDPAAMELGSAPNSIDTLSPNNRAVRYSSKIPPRVSIPFHSLMGDRGKGDTPDSSDGVVAYWSSHLDGAASEKIIPHHHSSHQHPEAIAEVKRILKLHAAE